MIDVRRARGRDLDACLALRHAVFCLEQGVPEAIERDGVDADAVHLAAVARGGRVVGTCRVLPGAPAWHLGRMAVAREWRGRGVGVLVLRAAQRHARAAGGREMRLAAQLPVRGFYEREGYVAEGEAFQVAGIPHLRMRRPLPASGRVATGGGAAPAAPPGA